MLIVNMEIFEEFLILLHIFQSESNIEILLLYMIKINSESITYD